MKPIEVQLKDHPLSELQKKIKQNCKERHEDLISLLKKDFTSFEEFYARILKSYTMNTSLYMNLNKYLRNESWIEIDNLLPYAICLCKAFFSFKGNKNSQKEAKQDSIFLYRGTALDELALISYQTKEASKGFSWNSVTSTSRNREIAENFMYGSVDIKNKKYPVLFIIEIPLGNEVRESESLKWIDINKYSAMPDEDEVILAPGSAFELVNFSIDQEKRATIKVKLKPEVESLAHQGLIMQGAFQNEMMNDKQAKIMCLEREELFEALKNLAGNRLIEEIEFCLCNFDQRSLEEILLTLPTLNKAKGLKFISCKYGGEQEISSARLQGIKGGNIEKIEIAQVQDLVKILRLNKQDDNLWVSLKTLNIAFRYLQFDACEFQALTFPKGLTSLTLDFSYDREIKDEGVSHLAGQGLKHITQLTSLALNFTRCAKITDEGVSNLAGQGLKYLTQLTSLTLYFSDCNEITNEGVRNLVVQGLKYLTQLTSLTLDFSLCAQITDEGLRNLAAQGLKCLTQLTSLTLNLSYIDNRPYFKKITDEGVNNLAAQGLKHLTQLTSLNLDFSDVREITKEGVNNLAAQGLKHLTQLTSLTLNFSHGREITDAGVNNLAAQGLKHLTQLTALTLNLSDCFQITDQGMSNMTAQGLTYLTQLTSLTLNFSWCREITDKGVNLLVVQGLKYLTQLTSLTLNFSLCNKITDKAKSNLAAQGLKYLTQLTLFTLNGRVITQSCQHHQIDEDQGLTNKSLRLNFTRQTSQDQLRYLVDDSSRSTSSFENRNLEELNLLPKEYKEIEKALDKLLLQLIPSNLPSLSHRKIVSIKWNLDEKPDKKTLDFLVTSFQAFTQISDSLSYKIDHFSESEQIKHKGEGNLAAQGLKYLTQLTSLTLDFSYGKEIIDEGVSNLAGQGLKYLTQLTSLTLNFSWCVKITDKGVSNLAAQGLKYLTQLTSLTLDFACCNEITNEGVSNLAAQGLKYLTQLTSLTLSFSRLITPLFLGVTPWREITNEGVSNLAAQGLKYLTQLTSLTLDFTRSTQITDEGVSNLANQGLKNLTQLTSLTLNLTDCFRITDEGVNDLIYQIIRSSIQLTTLILDFSSSGVTKFTARSIAKVLRYSGFIEMQAKSNN